MPMILFGHRKSLKYGSIQLYVNELDLVMEISFIKAYSAPASGSYTRAKRRHADAIKWYLIKIYLDKNIELVFKIVTLN
jgi:hypothetical protein